MSFVALIVCKKCIAYARLCDLKLLTHVILNIITRRLSPPTSSADE